MRKPKRGDKMIVPKGTLVKSLNPRRKGKLRTITVARVDENARVFWAGEGSYWCWAAVENLRYPL